MAAKGPKEDICKAIQEDWANREYIEIIAGSLKKISDFLNSFDASSRGRLAELSEKLSDLERRVDHFEARLSRSELINNNNINNNTAENQ